MQFAVDGLLHDFDDLKIYRARHHLPDSFGMNVFDEKSYEGLGSIEHAGLELVALKQRLCADMPQLGTTQRWLLYLPTLSQQFREALEAMNHVVGLRDVEMDFAAAGFGDMCNRWVYALVYGDQTRGKSPRFEDIYRDWLMDSIRVSHVIYPYPHHQQVWKIRLISHVYGRMGLMIKRDESTDFVYDSRYACPAEGYMLGLLRTVTEQIALDCRVV